MKRYKYLLFCLVIVMFVSSLAGCSTSGSQVPTQPSTQSNTLASTQSPPQTSAPASNQSGVLVPLPSFYDLADLVEHSVVAVNTETAVFRGTIQGAGSGWIINESGVIVTNNHVIEGAQSVTVQLLDGTTFTPVSIKADPATDLAVLKINAGRNLPALKVGDVSTLRIGDWVVAVGNALGMGLSVKDGIVSRLGVSVQISTTETYSNLIETNAAINPGNSGGPLVNLSGEVVGITSLKLSTAGVEGMGYAINIADALPVIQKLSK
jgi:serine protease Do